MKRPAQHRIKTETELLQSKWGQAAANPHARKKAVSRATAVAKKSGNSKLAAKVSTAVDIVKTGGINGQQLTPLHITLIVAALLYVVSPLDFIPDVVPVIGWLDDLGVLAIAFNSIYSLCTRTSESRLEADDEQEEELLEQVEWHLDHADKSFANETSLQDELETLQNEADELGDVLLSEQCQTLGANALDPLRRIIVTGTFNAGKTSLINRLLGDACLPVGITPTTQTLTTLMHGEKFQAMVRMKDGGIETTEDPTELRDIRSRIYRDIDELVVYHPADILSNGFCIVDTPGLRDKVYALDFDALPRSDAFVYVKSLDVADFTADELAFLAEAAGHLSPRQLILVLSKTDAVEYVEELNQVEQDMRLSLMKYGLSGIPVYRVTDRGNGDMLPDLCQELLQRAQGSLQAQHEETVRQAASAMRQAIDTTRQKQEQLASMTAAELAQRQAKLQEKKQEVQERANRRKETLRDAFRANLHTFLTDKLYPNICNEIDRNTINERYVAALNSRIRAELGQYLDERCRELGEQLGTPLQKDDSARIKANVSSDLESPDNPMGGMADYAKFILPGIALATFFPMGIFAWLTTIAVPTYLMDKFGVGGGFGALLKTVGQSGVRKELKNKVHDMLHELETSIDARMAEILERSIAQVIQTNCKLLELQH